MTMIIEKQEKKGHKRRKHEKFDIPERRDQCKKNIHAIASKSQNKLGKHDIRIHDAKKNRISKQGQKYDDTRDKKAGYQNREKSPNKIFSFWHNFKSYPLS